MILRMSFLMNFPFHQLIKEPFNLLWKNGIFGFAGKKLSIWEKLRKRRIQHYPKIGTVTLN